MTDYEVCRLTGLDKAALSRFRSGKCGLTLRSLDRLAEVLGWELVARKATLAASGRTKNKRR
jgi:transcriptional regulator with XRE-family HTH domain